MTVTLTPELVQVVEQHVASGRYDSPNEVIRDALRLLQRRDERRRTRLEKLKAAIAEGIDAADRGEVVPAEQVFRELRELADQIARRDR